MATYKAIILKGEIHLKSDGTTNIKIRITQNSKHSYIKTKFYVIPEFWNPATGRCKAGWVNAKFINSELSRILSNFQIKDIEGGDDFEYLTATQIRTTQQKEKKEFIDFIDFSVSIIEKLEDTGKTSTASWHRVLITNLKTFIDQPTLNVMYITSDFLQRFENYLFTKETPKTAGGINVDMRSFRSLFNQCRDFYNDENTGKLKIPHYPFKGYKIPQIKRRMQGKSLTIVEIKQIIEYVPKDKHRAFAKDIFLLMFCLIGINAKDLYYLIKPKGKRIEFDRFKTGRNYSIKLEPETIELIKKYEHETNLLNLCDNYSNHKNFTKQLDLHLKKIAKDLEILKPIASNFARHTWATIARNDCRISKDDVALCLGHEDEDNKITDTYIDYDYSIQDKANRKVLTLVYKPIPIKKTRKSKTQ